jgi:type IV secretory pathway VirJ component
MSARKSLRGRTLAPGAAILVCMATLAGCAAQLASKPGLFDARREPVTLPNRSVHLTYVRPVKPRAPFLILYASGDAGMTGTSNAVFEHLADQGYYVAAYSSREALRPTKRSGEPMEISEAAADVAAMIAQAKRGLSLPEQTPTVVAGTSRGASMVVFAAAEPTVRSAVAGAIAIALTRESDYLRAPDPAHRGPAIQLDDKGGLLTYPIVARLDWLPVAVIQSTGDSYVTAAEWRRQLGPDTATRRLYEVEARNHGFSGGRDALLRALDDALHWVAAAIAAVSPPTP